MKAIGITVKNWDKFNPRADRANYTWLRLQNTFFADQAIFTLTDSQQLLYLFICCECSKKNCGEVDLVPEYIAANRKSSVPKIMADLRVLESAGVVVTADSRQSDGDEPSLLPATIRNVTNETKRDETNDTHTREAPDAPDVCEIWNLNCSPLPTARETGLARLRHWRNRWREKPDAEYWASVVKRLAASPFCQGKNDSGWRANIDFFLRPQTHVKAMEGQYDAGPGRRRQTHAESVSAANLELYQRIERGEV